MSKVATQVQSVPMPHDLLGCSFYGLNSKLGAQCSGWTITGMGPGPAASTAGGSSLFKSFARSRPPHLQPGGSRGGGSGRSVVLTDQPHVTLYARRTQQQLESERTAANAALTLPSMSPLVPRRVGLVTAAAAAGGGRGAAAIAVQPTVQPMIGSLAPVLIGPAGLAGDVLTSSPESEHGSSRGKQGPQAAAATTAGGTTSRPARGRTWGRAGIGNSSGGRSSGRSGSDAAGSSAVLRGRGGGSAGSVATGSGSRSGSRRGGQARAGEVAASGPGGNGGAV